MSEDWLKDPPEEHDVLGTALAATGLCDDCLAAYPPALLKAVDDNFDYALRLDTGEVVYFETCSLVGGGWVHLEGVRHDHYTSPWQGHAEHPPGQRLPVAAPRGLDVHVRHIVWAADAPWGS